MDYNKIISITGMPGLYELLSSRADGAVVKSLEDNSTKFASSRQHQFSHLESIEIYTTSDNTYLGDVFQKMKNSDEKVENAGLIVKTIMVDCGRVIKRMRPAPQGRGYRVRKRSNHVTIIVDSNTDNRVPSVKKLIPKEEPVATEPVKKTEKTTKPVTKKAPAKKTPAAKKATTKKETSAEDKSDKKSSTKNTKK